MPDKQYSLEQVLKSIGQTLSARYTSTYWVKTEINKLNFYPHSGHYYPELVEKKNGKTVAQARGILWKNDAERIQKELREKTGSPLREGIQVLCLCSIVFDPLHGLSLRIEEVDTTFALGELEKEKQETITRLQSENLFSRNKTLTLALVPKRIAIISVESSKGLSDFLQVIQANPEAFRIEWTLFPALLQGDRSVESIKSQLKKIALKKEAFDAVALIRGGGGEVGLASYNQYELAKAVAEFPLPVLTGIGHSTNETVTELVAYKKAITPTELADFILDRYRHLHHFLQEAGTLVSRYSKQVIKTGSDQVNLTTEKLNWHVKHLLQEHRHQFSQQQHQIKHLSTALIQQYRHSLAQRHQACQRVAVDILKEQLQRLLKYQTAASLLTAQQLKLEHWQLQSLENHVRLLHPQRVLERGYSITLHEGKSIQDPNQLKPGDRITTVLEKGIILSTLNQVKDEDPSL
ncbi:MAG: exodeoxyribonuclease VII large subunit [Cytophagaceae bacterium]|jgi:exodeoxyribonuclease VII large subunit|nr:exodeoxyribonuclease VII large subunit [Cytophagaceae bacterium]